MSRTKELWQDHLEEMQQHPEMDADYIRWCDQESERPTIESVQCMALREARKDDSFIGLLERRLKR